VNAEGLVWFWKTPSLSFVLVSVPESSLIGIKLAARTLSCFSSSFHLGLVIIL